MTQSQEIRRHRDGSIDFDFYRARAVALRSQAMREAFELKSTLKFVLVTAVAITAVTVVAAPARFVDDAAMQRTANG